MRRYLFFSISLQFPFIRSQLCNSPSRNRCCSVHNSMVNRQEFCFSPSCISPVIVSQQSTLTVRLQLKGIISTLIFSTPYASAVFYSLSFHWWIYCPTVFVHDLKSGVINKTEPFYKTLYTNTVNNFGIGHRANWLDIVCKLNCRNASFLKNFTNSCLLKQDFIILKSCDRLCRMSCSNQRQHNFPVLLSVDHYWKPLLR